MLRTAVLSLVVACATAQRTRYLLDPNWKFQLIGAPTPSSCANPSDFNISYNNRQCAGLQAAAYANDEASCLAACCADSTCDVYQWCPPGNAVCSPSPSCWIGKAAGGCSNPVPNTWVSKGRTPLPPPPPGPGPGGCTDPACLPATDDSSWRTLNLPHDFVVEGNFTQTAIMSHGYLPLGKGWYRRHATIPVSARGTTMYLDFDGTQSANVVYLNGFYVGAHNSGYTPSRYYINASWVNWGAENLLAVFVDGTQPDGWWYDGGGIYRHVWLTSIATPGPYLGPEGIYAPSSVSGPITWVSGAPFGTGVLSPSVEVWNNGSATSTDFSLSLTVTDASGAVVGSASGSGSVGGGGGVVTWSPSSPITIPNAALWHLVDAPLKPALYTLHTTLTVGGVAVDAHNTTFGIRRTAWSNATGFYLNDVAIKIMGTANHQDYAGMGVAFPDHLQWNRVAKLKEMGVNGWRTAHNPPTPALLDACDEEGFLVWDENHRNGQFDQVPLLVRRDRNHPSVVIWSICNEVLCNTNNDKTTAVAMKDLFHELDPLGNRPVSANQNGWVGPDTPLDVQGFDYSTGNYDNWHKEAPGIPSISSETSSAVSDRGEYKNDPVSGHVQGYDNQYPGWGESAEQAWAGVGMSNGQGILTRPFISGGWTWTGWDYKGEPTPYSWPNINSHFGILDIAGFPKDRFYWYKANFIPTVPLVHAFPHWNWATGDAYPIWAFSNTEEVELFVNGVSQGRKAMPLGGHAEWDALPWVAGGYTVLGYDTGSSTVKASITRNTTGAPTALRVSIKDGMPGPQGMIAGCVDVGLVQVEVVDASGLVVPTANNTLTFTITGPATLGGTGNGDPSDHTNDKSPVRPAFHGLALAVILGGTDAGSVVVSVSTPGLPTASVTIPQIAMPAGYEQKWCHTNPTL